MNKDLQNQIAQVENLVAEAKANLKSWASQISQHYKTLKNLTSQAEAIKNQLMNQPKNQLNNSNK